jgi:hypothetical protein
VVNESSAATLQEVTVNDCSFYNYAAGNRGVEVNAAASALITDLVVTNSIFYSDSCVDHVGLGTLSRVKISGNVIVDASTSIARNVGAGNYTKVAVTSNHIVSAACMFRQVAGTLDQCYHSDNVLNATYTTSHTIGTVTTVTAGQADVVWT